MNFINEIINKLSYDPESPLIFSSGIFWVMFLVFMPLYGMIRNRKVQMLSFVTLFSFYFYYKCSGFFVLLLIFTSLLDWVVSLLMSKEGVRKPLKRLYLIISICSSIGILIYFKYANFFLWNFNTLLHTNFDPLELILPVGISFYTFQSVSYVIDVYKGRIKATDTWLEYAFFLSFFPALVAGPIVRADYFIPQIKENHHATKNELYTGLLFILFGVIKKAIVADYLAQYNDLIFNAPGDYAGFEVLMAIIGYMVQIYCDFSGYSDMAIGIALIMGFRLNQNFNFPFKATNLSDFWRRWHISLSSWLKDYIYIPLGGNRKGTARTYLNNMLTMLIGGLWHGAAWKYIIWGGLHGGGLAVHKASKPWLQKIPDNNFTNAIFWLITMLFLALTFVVFRAANWHDSMVITSSVFRDFYIASIPAFISARTTWLILLSLIIVTHALPQRFWRLLTVAFVYSPWVDKLIIFIIVIQLVLELQSSEITPFIYFQF